MDKKKVIRVNFIDGSSKAFALDVTATAQQLREIAVERIGMKEDGCFALFEKRFEWERCLEPEERPVDLQESWNNSPSCFFLLKEENFPQR